MTKQQLKNYRAVKRMIREMEIDIKENTVSDTVKGSKSSFPYTQRTIGISGDMRSDLRRRSAVIEKYRHEAAEVESFVKGINDTVTRRIFEIRYIKGERRPSWNRVAYLLGGGNTPDGVRKNHDRFLKKIIQK